MTRTAAMFITLAAVLIATVPASASFPGQNGAIVFQDQGEVKLVNPDGSGLRTLSTGTANRDPALSPDGSLVVYEQGRDLVVSPTSGSGTKSVTTGGNNDQFPAFSPDGKQIVFHRADATDLFVVNVDGTGLRQLTSDGSAYAEYEPEWSPRGDKIAFERPGCDEQGGQVCIFTVNADGSGLTNLTPEEYPADCPNVNPGVGPRGNSANPTWSPDGTKIAYAGTAFHCQQAEGNISGGDIWVMNADGSAKRDILPDANDATYDAQPSWSPDGQSIAFQTDRFNGGNNGDRDIAIMPAAGGAPVKVIGAGTSGADPQPNWGPRAIPGIIGTAGDDLLNGTEKNDLMRGLGGNDILNGLQGDDVMDGGAGNDKLTGSEGNDQIAGADGTDVLVGATGNDILAGAGGRDNLTGGRGNDRLSGGAGNDKLDGGQGKNTFDAGAGNDVVNSANGRRETVRCGAGRDSGRADRVDRLVGCERVRRSR